MVTAAFQGSVVRVKVRLDDTDALVNVDAPVDSLEMPNQGDRVRIKVEAKRAFVETLADGTEAAA